MIRSRVLRFRVWISRTEQKDAKATIAPARTNPPGNDCRYRNQYSVGSVLAVPIVAIPNVGENQVIVLTPWPGRSPGCGGPDYVPTQRVDVGCSRSESVRAKSLFGYSFVRYLADAVDFYCASFRAAASPVPPMV